MVVPVTDMSVREPHMVCNWCLKPDNDSNACLKCKTMLSKAIRKHTMKLLAI